MTQRNRAELEREVAELIIEKLNITHITADKVDIEFPLFSKENALELDSIDGIEIVVALQLSYGIRINDEIPKQEILYSVKTIVDFLIKENTTEKLV